MQKAVLITHTIIALLIIALVLLQRGKGADAGAAFGAGASGTVFGARGSSSFFSRATAVCATAFFITSLSLAYLSSQASSGPGSLLDNAPVIEEELDGENNLNDELPLPAAPSAEASDGSLDESDFPAIDESIEEGQGTE